MATSTSWHLPCFSTHQIETKNLSLTVHTRCDHTCGARHVRTGQTPVRSARKLCPRTPCAYVRTAHTATHFGRVSSVPSCPALDQSRWPPEQAAHPGRAQVTGSRVSHTWCTWHARANALGCRAGRAGTGGMGSSCGVRGACMHARLGPCAARGVGAAEGTKRAHHTCMLQRPGVSFYSVDITTDTSHTAHVRD